MMLSSLKKPNHPNLLVRLIIRRHFGVDFLGDELFAAECLDHVLNRLFAMRLLPLLGIVLP